MDASVPRSASAPLDIRRKVYIAISTVLKQHFQLVQFHSNPSNGILVTLTQLQKCTLQLDAMKYVLRGCSKLFVRLCLKRFRGCSKI